MAVNRYIYPSLPYDPIADFAPVTLICIYPNLMVRPELLAGEVGDGVHRLRQGEQRQDHVRLVRHRHLAPPLRRAVQAHDRHRDDARALSRRGARLERPHSRPGRCHVQHHGRRAAAGASRASARARGDLGEAVSDRAGISDRRGVRRAGFRRLVLVRLLRAGQDSARDREQSCTPTRSPVLAEPAIRERLAQTGVLVVGSTPAELGAQLKSETELWGPVIKAAGIKAEG